MDSTVIPTIRVICSEGPHYDSIQTSYDVPVEDFTSFIALVKCGFIDADPIAAFAYGIDFNKDLVIVNGATTWQNPPIQQPYQIFNRLLVSGPKDSLLIQQLDPDLKAYITRLLPQWLNVLKPEWWVTSHAIAFLTEVQTTSL